jgi:hypothetical protein
MEGSQLQTQQETQAVQPATFAVTHANTVQMLDLRYALSMDGCCIVDLTECEAGHKPLDEVFCAIVSALRRGVAVTLRVRQDSREHRRAARYALDTLERCDVEVTP